MTIKEFVKLVEQTRDAQNAFYRGGRTQTALREARNMERKLDGVLRMIRIGKVLLQGELFPADAEAKP